MGELVRQTPGLFGWDRLSPRYLRALHRNPLTVKLRNQSDQDFDRFMNSLENFEPFDDLEELSDNDELFMDAMAKPNKHADALLELAKLKKGKAKAPEQSSDSIYDKPLIKEPEGLTPTQSWLH